MFNQQLFICDWWHNVQCDEVPAHYELNANIYDYQWESKRMKKAAVMLPPDEIDQDELDHNELIRRVGLVQRSIQSNNGTRLIATTPRSIIIPTTSKSSSTTTTTTTTTMPSTTEPIESIIIDDDDELINSHDDDDDNDVDNELNSNLVPSTTQSSVSFTETVFGNRVGDTSLEKKKGRRSSQQNKILTGSSINNLGVKGGKLVKFNRIMTKPKLSSGTTSTAQTSFFNRFKYASNEFLKSQPLKQISSSPSSSSSSAAATAAAIINTFRNNRNPFSSTSSSSQFRSHPQSSSNFPSFTSALSSSSLHSGSRGKHYRA